MADLLIVILLTASLAGYLAWEQLIGPIPHD